MAEKTLRALARDYAKGELDKDAYRKSRADLIEGILSGAIPLQVNEYPAPRTIARYDGSVEGAQQRKRNRKKREAEDTTSVLVPQEATAPVPPPQAPVPQAASSAPALAEPEFVTGLEIDAGRETLWIPIGVFAGLLLVVGIVYLLLPDTSDEPASPAAVQATAQPAEEPARPAIAPNRQATDLVVKFLNDKKWSEAAMDEFLLQWQALPEEQRATMAGSGEMAQLNNAIYKNLVNERALSGLGDVEASLAKQRRLIAFAESLGIRDARLALPDATSQK